MSIVEVARAAGVSHATVSRVINGSGPVREETARRVRQAMARLGYTPPPPERRRGRKARPPGTSAPRHLVMLCLDPDPVRHSGFRMALFRGAQEAADREGVDVSLMHAGDPPRLPRLVRERRVDGLLLVGVSPDPVLVRDIRRLPHLRLTSHAGVEGSDVLVGNEAVGRMAAAYLIERGHRSVAYLSAQEENPSYAVRGESFEKAAREAGVAVARFAGRSADALKRDLERLIRRMLGNRKIPTGLFCPSDCITALSCGILAECGLRAGRDVEFVSCDNEEPYLAGLSPRPATIDVGCEARGRAGVEQLLLRIRHPGADRRAHLLIEPVLIPPLPPIPPGGKGRRGSNPFLRR